MSYFTDMCAQTGYEPKTTFWEDFTLAEIYGIPSIKDTYNRAVREWRYNVEYYTELTMVVNWKSWYWHYAGNYQLSEMYADYYYELYNWGLNNYTDEDLNYFWRTLD